MPGPDPHEPRLIALHRVRSDLAEARQDLDIHVETEDQVHAADEAGGIREPGLRAAGHHLATKPGQIEGKVPAAAGESMQTELADGQIIEERA